MRVAATDVKSPTKSKTQKAHVSQLFTMRTLPKAAKRHNGLGRATHVARIRNGKTPGACVCAHEKKKCVWSGGCFFHATTQLLKDELILLPRSWSRGTSDDGCCSAGTGAARVKVTNESI